MLHAGEYAFASRNQPNYAWWRPLAEIVAVAVLTVAFVAVIGVSLEAAGVDTSSGAADKYFGYGSVVVEILAVLLAVRFIGRRPVASVFTGRTGTKPWVPFAAYALAFVVIAAVMGVVGVVGYGASWDQVIGDIRSDLPLELVVIVLAALAEEMAFRGVEHLRLGPSPGNPELGCEHGGGIRGCGGGFRRGDCSATPRRVG